MNIHEQHNRLTLTDDSGRKIGEVTFRQSGDRILILDHTYVDPEFRGKHLASRLVRAVVDKARAENKKILPLCSFASAEFKRISAYQDVAAEVNGPTKQ